MRIAIRGQAGQGVIMLSVAIGLIIIPLLGLFAFEVARYQHGVMQLENNCDSAALAGAAMLVTSQYQLPSERQQRWNDVEAAAGNALKSTFPATASQLQDVLGTDMKTAVNVGTGNTPKLGTQAGHCEYALEPVDPSTFNAVAVTATNAKSVRVKALFTAVPAFARYLGQRSLVPVYAKATAGIPVLDLVVCFDVSGSMDDSTRVSLVMRQWRLAQSDYPQLQTAYDNYRNAVAAFNSRWAYASNCKGYAADLAAVNSLWTNSSGTGYIDLRSRLGNAHGYMDYHQVMTGTLAEVIFKQPYAPEGWPANLQYPQNLETLITGNPSPAVANPGLQPFDYPERYGQEWALSFRGAPAPTIKEFPSNWDAQCVDPIQYGTWTDLVIKADPTIANNLQPDGRPQQPLFFPQATSAEWPDPGTSAPVVHPGVIRYKKIREPYKGKMYTFDGMAYLVEAARGNLEYTTYENLKSKGLFTQNIAQGQLPNTGQDGYQSAYQEMVSFYSQPIASTVGALENFYQALNSVGADVFFGVSSFESEVGNTPGARTTASLPDIAATSPVINDGWLSPTLNRHRPLYFSKLQPMVQPDTTMVADPYGGASTTLYDQFENYLVPMRSTNIPGALKSALSMLNASPRKAFARQAILLITDGIATVTADGTPCATGLNTAASQESRQYAKQANNQHIPIFCVGVAQNNSVLNLQKQFLGDTITSPGEGLASLSGNGARYFQITYNDLTVNGNSKNQQTNAISESLQQVVRGFVQLME